MYARILYVDDDPATTDLVARYLEHRRDDLAVVTTTDPVAGLARVEEDAFACVVSDLQMPRMDGVEFIEAVRETRPDLPWLLYTNAPREAIDRGVAADRVISKGDACEELAARVGSIVGQEETTADSIGPLASD